MWCSLIAYSFNFFGINPRISICQKFLPGDVWLWNKLTYKNSSTLTVRGWNKSISENDLLIYVNLCDDLLLPPKPPTESIKNIS